MLNVKQGNCEYQLLKSIGLTRPGNRTLVYRLRRERYIVCQTQWRSQDFSMGGALTGTAGGWGSGGKVPSRQRQGSLGAEPLALGDLCNF